LRCQGLIYDSAPWSSHLTRVDKVLVHDRHHGSLRGSSQVIVDKNARGIEESRPRALIPCKFSSSGICRLGSRPQQASRTRPVGPDHLNWDGSALGQRTGLCRCLTLAMALSTPAKTHAAVHPLYLVDCVVGLGCAVDIILPCLNNGLTPSIMAWIIPDTVSMLQEGFTAFSLLSIQTN
jgi:hypothetical protein